MRTRTNASRRWNEEEDKLLEELVSRDLASRKEINWHDIAAHIKGRNNKDCRKRWIYALNPSVRKGPWSDEEDTLLLEGIRLHGFRWPLISQTVGTRQPDQCSRRWRETLNPNISHDRWTLLEDQLLKQAVEEYGRKWTEIVERYFPDRTPIAAKKRYVHRFENRNKNRHADGKGSNRPSKSSSDDSGSSISNGGEQENRSPQELPAMLWYMPDYSQRRGCPLLIQNAEGGFESAQPLTSPSTVVQGSTVPAFAAPIMNMTRSDIDQQSTMRPPNRVENTQISDSDHHQPHNQFQSQGSDVIDGMAIVEALYERVEPSDILEGQGAEGYSKDAIRCSSAFDMFQDCRRHSTQMLYDWTIDLPSISLYEDIWPESRGDDASARSSS